MLLRRKLEGRGGMRGMSGGKMGLSGEGGIFSIYWSPGDNAVYVPVEPFLFAAKRPQHARARGLGRGASSFVLFGDIFPRLAPR
jgi:hypothetical protein